MTLRWKKTMNNNGTSRAHTERCRQHKVCRCCLVAKSCPILCDLMDCSPPGSSVHGIFKARILEWVSISFSRTSSRPRDWTLISCTDRRILLPLSHQKVLYSEANIFYRMQEGFPILHAEAFLLILFTLKWQVHSQHRNTRWDKF